MPDMFNLKTNEEAILLEKLKQLKLDSESLDKISTNMKVITKVASNLSSITTLEPQLSSIEKLLSNLPILVELAYSLGTMRKLARNLDNISSLAEREDIIDYVVSISKDIEIVSKHIDSIHNVSGEVLPLKSVFKNLPELLELHSVKSELVNIPHRELLRSIKNIDFDSVYTVSSKIDKIESIDYEAIHKASLIDKDIVKELNEAKQAYDKSYLKLSKLLNRVMEVNDVN